MARICKVCGGTPMAKDIVNNHHLILVRGCDGESEWDVCGPVQEQHIIGYLNESGGGTTLCEHCVDQVGGHATPVYGTEEDAAEMSCGLCGESLEEKS